MFTRAFKNKDKKEKEKESTLSSELSVKKRFDDLENFFLKNNNIDSVQRKTPISTKLVTTSLKFKSEDSELPPPLPPLIIIEQKDEEIPPPFIAPLLHEKHQFQENCINKKEELIVQAKNKHLLIQSDEEKLAKLCQEREKYANGLTTRLKYLTLEIENRHEELTRKKEYLLKQENESQILNEKIKAKLRQLEEVKLARLNIESKIRNAEETIQMQTHKQAELEKTFETLKDDLFLYEENLDTQKTIIRLKENRISTLEKQKDELIHSLKKSPTKKQLPKPIN